MLDDLDTTIASVLGELLTTPRTVTFDRPGGEGWDSSPSRPTLSCSLTEIVEDDARRSAAWSDLRDADGLVEARQAPERWMSVRYRVTAWASDVATEHALLGEVLQALVLDQVIADSHRSGAFAETDDRLVLECAPAPTAGDDRPALRLAVTIPVRPQLEVDIASPAKEIDLDMRRIGPDAEGRDHPVEHDATPAAATNHRWTTFRIREST